MVIGEFYSASTLQFLMQSRYTRINIVQFKN